VGDKDYGTNAFMVQMRDVDTFKHVKGVESGDLGPKFAYASKDNGWATYHHVRIPRRNMLMAISAVSKEGEFSKKADPRVLYTTMMLIRTSIVIDSPS
jgi:acyl-CoA oxidase